MKIKNNTNFLSKCANEKMPMNNVLDSKKTMTTNRVGGPSLSYFLIFYDDVLVVSNKLVLRRRLELPPRSFKKDPNCSLCCQRRVLVHTTCTATNNKKDMTSLFTCSLIGGPCVCECGLC